MEKTTKMESCFVFDRPVSENEILYLAKEITAARLIRAGPQISSPQLAEDFLSHLIGSNEREVFLVIFLDAQHKIIASEELFQGTINSSPVYPREIVKRVLFHNAAAVILAHNHPSGYPAPSDNDKQVTTRLKEALALIETPVLDHLILAGSNWFSFADSGIL
jgi:DNA repair protein RadC